MSSPRQRNASGRRRPGKETRQDAVAAARRRSSASAASRFRSRASVRHTTAGRGAPSSPPSSGTTTSACSYSGLRCAPSSCSLAVVARMLSSSCRAGAGAAGRGVSDGMGAGGELWRASAGMLCRAGAGSWGLAWSRHWAHRIGPGSRRRCRSRAGRLSMAPHTSPLPASSGRVDVPSRTTRLASSSGAPLSQTTTPACRDPQLMGRSTAPPPVATTHCLYGASSWRFRGGFGGGGGVREGELLVCDGAALVGSRNAMPLHPHACVRARPLSNPAHLQHLRLQVPERVFPLLSENVRNGPPRQLHYHVVRIKKGVAQHPAQLLPHRALAAAESEVQEGEGGGPFQPGPGGVVRQPRAVHARASQSAQDARAGPRGSTRTCPSCQSGRRWFRPGAVPPRAPAPGV